MIAGKAYRYLIPLVSVAAMLSLFSCAYKTPLPLTSDLAQPSPKLNPFIYFEEGAVMFVGVDGRAAQYVKEGTIFPLGLGLTNHMRKPLTFRRENFVLQDGKGMRYPLVSVEEFNREYKRSRIDRKMADAMYEVMSTRYRQYPRQPWSLYPAKGNTGTTSDTVELQRNHWLVTYLYFPIPEGGIHGNEFSLLVNVDETEETYTVRFLLK